jgi:sugar O-acyltransferase (sialic acid O-acetyltransferase NeuD family)
MWPERLPATSKTVSLVGGGEHALVVADTIERLGHRLAGCWGPACDPSLVLLGNDAELEALIRSGAAPSLHLAMAGQAGTDTRRRVAERLGAAGPIAWISLCHPSAVIAKSAVLEPGAFVAAGAVVNPGAVVRRHAIVNTGAIVEHDVVVDEGAHLCPGAVTGGKARIGAWAVVGLGAKVRDHVSVGPQAVVGMGAVVVRDVPEAAWVIGNPARNMAR